MNNVKRNYALLLCIMIGLWIGSLRTMDDPDIWFQLLAGQYTLNHGQVPHHDFFLYEGQMNPQRFGGWGFGLFYYKVIEWGGLTAASVVNALIWMSIMMGGLKVALLRSKKQWKDLGVEAQWKIVMVMSVINVAFSSRMGLRAESTLIGMWILGLLAWEICKEKNKTYWAGFIFIGLSWLEAMLHTGGFVLLAWLPLCIIDEWDRQRKEFLNKKKLGYWGFIVIGMITIPCLNPNGPEQVYGHLWNIITSLKNDVKGEAATNLEYLSLWDPRSFWIVPKFLGLFSLPVLAWWVVRSWRSKAEIMLSLCFLVLACLHVRGISLAAMIMLPYALEAMLNSRNRWEIHEKKSILINTGLLTAFVLVVPWMVSSSLYNYGLQKETMGYDEELAKIKESHPNGARIFTVENGPKLVFLLGGDQYLVSKGGHTLIENPEASNHQELVVNATEIWEQELNNKKVDFIYIPFYVPMPGGGIFYWLNSMVVAQNNWKLHSIKKDGALFERLPEEKKLTPKEVETQTIDYLTYLSWYENATYYGRADEVGRAISKKAKLKLEALKKKKSEVQSH